MTSHTRQEGEPFREGEKTSVVYFDLMRHANRFAGRGEWTDPATGEKFQWKDTESLTPAGKENAKQFGANYSEDVDFVVGIGSLEARTGETVADIAKGSKRGGKLGPSSVLGISYKELSPESAGVTKKFRPLIEEAARKFPDYGRLDPKTRAKVRESCQTVGMGRAMEDRGIVREMAEGIAYNFWAARYISGEAHRTKPGMRVGMPIVSHGMYNESFLLEALKVIDSQTGSETRLNSIEDLGGFFQPGESFRIVDTRKGRKETFDCSFTSRERRKLFAGKKLLIDWGAVRSLAVAYDRRIHNGRSIIEGENMSQ